MPCVTPLRLAVALDGDGWHAAARPVAAIGQADNYAADHWIGLAQEAERGKLDFVTIAGPPAGFDAALVAARAAQQTSRIGVIPAIGTTPSTSRIATAVAVLDSVSSGRAGWLTHPDRGELVEAVHRLWDSWQQDGTDRAGTDQAGTDRAGTDRPGDIEALDDFERHFGDDGPARTVRPPQDRPVVLTRVDGAAQPRFAARSADVVLVNPTDEDDVRRIVADVRAQESAAGRTGAGARVFADLAVVLADTEAAATARKDRLDELHGSEFTSDETLFVGTPVQLMRRLQAWQRAGTEGFRLHPAVLADDLPAITRGLVPALQENDAFRRGYEARNLRGLLGLPRPVNRVPAADSATG
jgi:alkanesulfonate monooxygenase SsuD/methylene tetrahydromethanopterin reductase-like flavin-dependent oxidoreductase (luciferase family)